ncbi:hypothetical protein SAMN04489727_1041 [Amycolatopsis tolypomycina]|uniref:Excreted virulence factor EspC, type VII ESX diderm n=1 Tax=Amycolatopsis tolypomycina TaxID=208445 RepID=A0A1H4ILW8_9PSEU|nr:hypothetical protein [Amycolatopsis tolypomycina]SEB34666.1 hypothetical protein SAMN04489727_1041 [Amycolatopsis tolypomycina]
MAGLKMDGVVVARYAETADAAAADLDAAAAEVGGDVGAESYGALGAQLGLGESYGRAAGALRRQLADGAEALRSAAEALRQVTVRHGGQDEEAAELIKRAGRLE